MLDQLGQFLGDHYDYMTTPDPNQTPFMNMLRMGVPGLPANAVKALIVNPATAIRNQFGEGVSNFFTKPEAELLAQEQAQQQAASSQQLIQLQQTLMQKETAKSRLEKEIFDLKKRMSQIELASARASQQ